MSNGNSVFDVVKNGLGSFFGSSSDENVSDENNNDKSSKYKEANYHLMNKLIVPFSLSSSEIS